MRYFKVKVNGSIYEVEVEEVSQLEGITSARAVSTSGAPDPIARQPALQPDSQATKALQPAVQPVTNQTASQIVKCPMPGKILDIKVSVGDEVKVNQPVAILEAMKMENEIVTPYAGKVLQVKAAKGQSINSGDVIITIA